MKCQIIKERLGKNLWNSIALAHTVSNAMFISLVLVKLCKVQSPTEATFTVSA